MKKLKQLTKLIKMKSMRTLSLSILCISMLVYSMNGFTAESSMLNSLFTTSGGIAILSGIAGGWSLKLYTEADKQANECDKNLQKIEALIKVYKDTTQDFCPNGHDKIEEPMCYCYNQDGSQNNNRTNSQTCKDLWGKFGYRISTTKGNYNPAAGPSNPSGCMMLNGQFDQACNCKKMKNASGQDACMKVTVASMGIPSGMGSAMGQAGLGTVVQQANDFANGNGNLNSGNIAKMQNALGKSKQMLNQMTTKNPNLLKQVPVLDDKNLNAVAAKVFGPSDIAKASQSDSSPFGTLNNASSGLSPELKKAIEEVQQKAGLELVGGAGVAKKKDAKQASIALSLAEGANGQASGQVQNFSEAPKDYKLNDINKNDNTNIFDIISNRYINSGLKRLFDDEKK